MCGPASTKKAPGQEIGRAGAPNGPGGPGGPGRKRNLKPKGTRALDAETHAARNGYGDEWESIINKQIRIHFHGDYIVVTILNIMGNGDLTIRHGDPRYEFDIIAFGNFTVS